VAQIMKRLSDKNTGLSNGRIDCSNPCGYCGAAQSLRLYPTCSISGDNFYISRCLKCNAVFLAPRPTQRQLDRAYDDSYYGRGVAKFTGPIEKVLDFFRSARARRVRRYVRPPGRVLDIGCGNGRFLGYLIQRGFEGYGTELPGKAAERAARIPGLELKVGLLTVGDFAENFFDAVSMWHVFEHLSKPKEVLQIIGKILKRKGYLFMSLPNIESIQSRVFRGKWLHLDPPKHLVFLGPSDLIAATKEFGFTLIQKKYFSLEQNPFGIQQSLLNCLLRDREVLFETLKGNVTYARRYAPCDIAVQRLFYLTTFGLFTFLACIEAALRKGGTVELVLQKQGS
jgi:SAM-dependent methyltransferase